MRYAMSLRPLSSAGSESRRCDVVGGLATALRADAGVVALGGPRVVAESLGHFVDAVTAVEQAGRQQVPDLVRTLLVLILATGEPAMAAVLVRASGTDRAAHFFRSSS